MTAGYCYCETPLMDVEHDAGCRRCGLPVNFSPTQCEHGVSFAPGRPDAEGRSEFCGECFPRAELLTPPDPVQLQVRRTTRAAAELVAGHPHETYDEVVALVAYAYAKGNRDGYAEGAAQADIVLAELLEVVPS